MTGFEPWTSSIGSDRSTNWATATALHSDTLQPLFHFDSAYSARYSDLKSALRHKLILKEVPASLKSLHISWEFKEWFVGSGCGSVGRAVAFNTRGPQVRIQSSAKIY